eukprot:179680-Alexandrium_andersonii.AAC.1
MCQASVPRARHAHCCTPQSRCARAVPQNTTRATSAAGARATSRWGIEAKRSTVVTRPTTAAVSVR